MSTETTRKTLTLPQSNIDRLPLSDHEFFSSPVDVEIIGAFGKFVEIRVPGRTTMIVQPEHLS